MSVAQAEPQYTVEEYLASSESPKSGTSIWTGKSSRWLARARSTPTFAVTWSFNSSAG